MSDRVRAFGLQLIEIHDRLRDEIEALRSGAGGSLSVHCLAFCDAVERHHLAEDRETFPAVAAAHPELADVVAELSRDHELVSGLLRQVRENPTATSLDTLAALLETHFTYEERTLARLLDDLDAGPRE